MYSVMKLVDESVNDRDTAGRLSVSLLQLNWSGKFGIMYGVICSTPLIAGCLGREFFASTH